VARAAPRPHRLASRSRPPRLRRPFELLELRAWQPYAVWYLTAYGGEPQVGRTERRQRSAPV